MGRDEEIEYEEFLGLAFQSTRPRGARPHWAQYAVSYQSVSIHAPAWGATAYRPIGRYQQEVSIHAPAWGATSHAPKRPIPRTRFNPRARVGRDIRAGAARVRAAAFQSTRPRGARPHTRARGLPVRCFNPRARVGRDGAGACGSAGTRVSIHAPAWGATNWPLQSWFHRPVSIHAPAWGATLQRRLCLQNGVRFQSTRPRGARLAYNVECVADSAFQSTRPRGARHCGGAPNRVCWGFNPRARVGRDAYVSFFGGRHESFNPRARVGRDRTSSFHAKPSSRFQSTRPRGARHPQRGGAERRRGRFNPRARVGRDGLYVHLFGALGRVSIHAPAWGATLPLGRARHAAHSFNPRARVGRDLPAGGRSS